MDNIIDFNTHLRVLAARAEGGAVAGAEPEAGDEADEPYVNDRLVTSNQVQKCLAALSITEQLRVSLRMGAKHE